MSAWGWIWRVGGVLVLLLILVVGGLLFYASTPHFANIVRQKVVTVLEDATGGRVEIQSMRWNLRHLAVEADNLTIHGLEGRSEKPYAHLDRLYARARILSFVDAQLGLDFLEVDRPAIHIIVYPDGRTNQPTPKAKQSANGSATKTIFDLQARRVEVHNGVALINERSIPFQLSANDLGVVITYAPLRGHYLGEISCSDIAAQRGKSVAVHSRLDLSVEAAPDAVDLKTLHFTSEKTSLQGSRESYPLCSAAMEAVHERHRGFGGSDSAGRNGRLQTWKRGPKRDGPGQRDGSICPGRPGEGGQCQLRH